MAEEPVPHAERDDLQEITVAIRAFPYYTDERDLVSGVMVRRERVAVRGETIQLAPADYQRAEKFGAFSSSNVAPAADREPGWDPNTQSLDEVTVEDVSLWLQREKPTVPQVVEEANNDPVRAQKLLDAENHATGQQPRSTLVEELETIINE